MLSLHSFAAYAQTPWIDSVKKVLVTQKTDTTKLYTLVSLSYSYQLYYPDSGLVYAQKALSLAEKLGNDNGIFASRMLWEAL